MVQINQYTQRTTPQGAMISPNIRPSPVPGAIGELGRAISDGADRVEEHIADRWLAENLPSLQSEVTEAQMGALQSAPPDGAGVTGRVIGDADKIRQKYLKLAPNKRAQDKLSIQANDYILGAKDRTLAKEFEMRTKHTVTGAQNGNDAVAKIVGVDPSQFSERLTERIFAINQLEIPGPEKAALIEETKLNISYAKVASEINADPGGWLKADKAKDLAWGLLPKEVQDKAIESAENEVYVRTQRAEAEKNRVERELLKSAYDAATDSVLKGTPFVMPRGLGSYNELQVEEMRKRLVDQKRYESLGGAVESDPAYHDDLLAMMSDDNKTPFMTMIIDRSRLSERDYNTFNNAQIKFKSGRSTAVADVGQEVTRAIVAAGLNKGPKATEMNRTLQMMALDAVAQQEEEKGRPLNREERQQTVDGLVMGAIKEKRYFGLTEVPVPSVKRLDIATAPISSRFMARYNIPITSETLLSAQQEINKQKDDLSSILENEGKPVTPQNLAIKYWELYQEMPSQ